MAAFGLALWILRAIFKTAQWHGTHDFTIRTSFGLMIALTALAFLARLPQITQGSRGIWRAALREGGRSGAC